MLLPDDDLFFCFVLGQRACRRWRCVEDKAEGQAAVASQNRAIPNDDPECEQLIAALEVGWLKDTGR